jgi:hypothetical protein
VSNEFILNEFNAGRLNNEYYEIAKKVKNINNDKELAEFKKDFYKTSLNKLKEVQKIAAETIGPIKKSSPEAAKAQQYFADWSGDVPYFSRISEQEAYKQGLIAGNEYSAIQAGQEYNLKFSMSTAKCVTDVMFKSLGRT